MSDDMKAGPTPGPWFAKREGFSTVYVEARIGGGMLQEVAACGPTQGGPDEQEANARLIAAAPDHSLFGAAVCAGKARWEAWSGSDCRGEVCVGGMRYATNLDEFGMPVLYDAIRAAIAKARGGS